jgi:hypothetical protein
MRRWRLTTALTAAQAAKKLGTDTGRFSRLERGVYRISDEEIRTLAEIYGLNDPEGVEEVIRANGQEAGWWAAYGDRLSESYRDFIELEADARTIRIHHPVIIPGLLQSPPYIHEMLTRGPGAVRRHEAEMLVNVRIGRQLIVTRDENPVDVHALVPESAFHVRFSEGSLVMRDQLQRLLLLSDLPNVTLQVVPLVTHPSYGSSGPMTLMTYRHPWVPIASVDNALGGHHTDDPAEVDFLEKDFRETASIALPVEQSREVIAERLEGLNK